MTFRTDPEFDEQETHPSGVQPALAGAAAAVSVLIIATITLTLVASGVNLSIALPLG